MAPEASPTLVLERLLAGSYPKVIPDETRGASQSSAFSACCATRSITEGHRRTGRRPRPGLPTSWRLHSCQKCSKGNDLDALSDPVAPFTGINHVQSV
jgi:hypothetical protein